jgi:hypothetical protein
MCGNKEFSEEFNAHYGNKKMSFSIINPADLIPKMPGHMRDENETQGILSKKR